MFTPINPPEVSASPFYSHGIEVRGVDRLLFVSGQVGSSADGSVPEGIAEQARIASGNLLAVLAAAGMTNANIAKVTIYLTDAANIGPFMEAAAGTLPELPPATTLLVVAQLADPRLLVEIEAIAVATAG